MKSSYQAIIPSIILGIIMAGIFRLGFIAITKDFSYYQIFMIEKFDLNAGTERDDFNQAIGWDYAGKELFNPPYSGFPFPTYGDCSIQGKGAISFSPACETIIFGEYATLLNALIWSTLFYLLFLSAQKIILKK